MRTIRQAVEDYISLRRSLGLKLKEKERRLREFVIFLHKKKASRISTLVALQFATQPQSVQPAEWTARLCAVRGFARYRSGDDPATRYLRSAFYRIDPRAHDLICTRRKRSGNCYKPPRICPQLTV